MFSLERAMTDFFKELRIPKDEWTDPGLDVAKTPGRISKMLRDELLSSYKPGAYEALCRRFTCFPSDGRDAMVVLGPIDFTSLCGHHLLPGQAFVGYVPGQCVIGASKVPRVVEHYSHMLQIQERMARQVSEFIYTKAEAKLVISLFRAKHECIGCRGVRQRNTLMTTTAIEPLDGLEENRGILNEFYSQVLLMDK
jgi:GTP cyclohydrolase I